MAVEIERLITRFEADTSDVRREMRMLRGMTDKTTGGMERRFTGIGRSIRGGLVGALAAVGVGTSLRGIIETNITFERLEARLRTFTRGNAPEAVRLFNELTKVAGDLPFGIDQTVDAFTRLGLLGLAPTTDAIKSFANIASAVGSQGAQSLKQVVEAVADATTFEFERLKELGIVARKQGNEINITLRGVTRTVKADAKSIAAFFEQLGTTEFAGAAEEQMKGLEGALSNLGDAFKLSARTIGESGLNEAITTAVNAITPLIQPATETAVQYLGASIASLKNALMEFAAIPLDVVDFVKDLFGFGEKEQQMTPQQFAPMTGAIGGAPGDIRGVARSLSLAPTGSLDDLLGGSQKDVVGAPKIKEENSTKTLRVLQSIDRKIITNLDPGAVMG